MNLGFKSTINWNKYLTKDPLKTQNWNLDNLVSPHFQGANIYFQLSFTNKADRRGQAWYYLPKAKKKKKGLQHKFSPNVFNWSVNIDIRTYKNIQNIFTGQENDFTIRCLLDYP